MPDILPVVDCYVYAAGPTTSVTAAHLANETGLVGWGTKDGVAQAITGLSANGSGVVDLTNSYTDVYVGLSFDWRYKSAKLAYGAAKGSALLQSKRVARIALATQNEHPNAITYGADFTTMYARPRVEKGQTVVETAVRTVLDTDSFALGSVWDTDSRVCLKGSAPYPASLLSLVVELETSEDD